MLAWIQDCHDGRARGMSTHVTICLVTCKTCSLQLRTYFSVLRYSFPPFSSMYLSPSWNAPKISTGVMARPAAPELMLLQISRSVAKIVSLFRRLSMSVECRLSSSNLLVDVHWSGVVNWTYIMSASIVLSTPEKDRRQRIQQHTRVEACQAECPLVTVRHSRQTAMPWCLL